MKTIRIHMFCDSLDFESDEIEVGDELKDLFEELSKEIDEEVVCDFEAYDTPVFRDKTFDFLIFDWGGMSLGNSLLDSFSRQLIEYLIEHPSKYVLIISQFTEHAMKDAQIQLDYNEPNILYSYEEMIDIIKNEILIGRNKND